MTGRIDRELPDRPVRVLVDVGHTASGGYLRYVRGIFGSPPPDVEVFLLCSPGIATALGPLDPTVHLLVEPRLDAPRRGTRLAWWRRDYPRLVRDVRPDLVVHPSGLLRGDSGGLPRVAVHHIMAPFTTATYRLYGLSRDSLRFLLLRTRLARSFRRADGVVFLSDFTCRAVSDQVRGIRRMTVVPNAVPPDFLAAPARSRDVLREPVSILCVSSLYLFKHQDHVVDAVADLRRDTGLDLRVAFVGGGEPKARARLLRAISARAAGDWAVLREQVPLDEMARLYAEGDLFVFPSADEAWPVTLGEAMAHGLPIACSDRMAMPSILRDAGVYFDPERPAQVADALRRLLSDGALRSAYGDRARRYAEAYTWDRSAAAFYAFLRQVVEARHVERGTRAADPRAGRPVVAGRT